MLWFLSSIGWEWSSEMLLLKWNPWYQWGWWDPGVAGVKGQYQGNRAGVMVLFGLYNPKKDSRSGKKRPVLSHQNGELWTLTKFSDLWPLNKGGLSTLQGAHNNITVTVTVNLLVFPKGTLSHLSMFLCFGKRNTRAFREYLEISPMLAVIPRVLKGLCGPLVRIEVSGVLWVEFCPWSGISSPINLWCLRHPVCGTCYSISCKLIHGDQVIKKEFWPGSISHIHPVVISQFQ